MKGKQLNDEDLDAIFGGVALNEDQIKKLGSKEQEEHDAYLTSAAQAAGAPEET